MVLLMMLSAVKSISKERSATEAPGLVRLVNFDLQAVGAGVGVGVGGERL